jgi:hypothetical protein
MGTSGLLFNMSKLSHIDYKLKVHIYWSTLKCHCFIVTQCCVGIKKNLNFVKSKALFVTIHQNHLQPFYTHKTISTWYIRIIKWTSNTFHSYSKIKIILLSHTWKYKTIPTPISLSPKMDIFVKTCTYVCLLSFWWSFLIGHIVFGCVGSKLGFSWFVFSFLYKKTLYST